MFEQSALLNSIKLMRGGHWVHDLALIQVEIDPNFCIEHSDRHGRAMIYQKAFAEEISRAIKQYTEYATPLARIQSYPSWLGAEERRRVYTPGWWLGSKPLAINLHRLPSTVLLEHRRYVWREMLKEIQCAAIDYKEFVDISIPALIRKNLPLCRLLRLAERYTTIPPIRQDYATLPDRWLASYFSKFNNYWPYVDQLWAQRRRMDSRSLYFREEESLQNVI